MSNKYFKLVNDSSTEDIDLEESSHHLNEEVAVGAETNDDEPQKSSKDENKNSGSDSLENNSSKDVSGERSLPQSLQDGTNVKDSQESLLSCGGSGTEFRQKSQPSVVTVDSESRQCDDSTESQSVCATVGVESQSVGAESQSVGATVGAESQSGSATVGTESQSGSATVGTESQSGSATVGTESQQNGDRGSEFRRETLSGGSTVGTEYQPEFHCSINSESSCVSFRPNRPTSQGSSNDCSSIHSRETVVVNDGTCQASMETGAAAGDVSDITNQQESPANGTGSEEGMAAPLQERRMESRVERDEKDIMSIYVWFFMPFFNKFNCVCRYLTPCSMWLQKHKIFKHIFRASLMIVALLTAAFGDIFFHHCRAIWFLPTLMILLGADLLIIILKPKFPWRAFKVIAHLLFAILFFMIMDFTFNMSPSFDHPDDEDYCPREFYYFAYYMNFVILAIITFAFVMHIPAAIENSRNYQLL